MTTLFEALDALVKETCEPPSLVVHERFIALRDEWAEGTDPCQWCKQPFADHIAVVVGRPAYCRDGHPYVAGPDE